MALPADLSTLANNLVKNGPVKVESTSRRVRALYNGVFLFDTTSAVHVWEHKYFPQFWIPLSSIAPNVLVKGDAFDGEKGAFSATVKVGQRSSDRVVLFETGPLEGLVRFEFAAMGKHFHHFFVFLGYLSFYDRRSG